MKIGVIVETLCLPLREGLQKAAEIGCEGVQLYATNPELDMRTASVSDVQQAARMIRDCGLVVSSVTGDLPGHGYSVPAEVPERVRMMKRIIDLSLELDCRAITNHIGVVPSDTAAPEWAIMVDSVGQVAEYAASRGSALAIETGPEPAVVLKRLIDTVGSRGLGINMDPANLKMVLNADAAEAVRVLAGHIFHTHAKDGMHYQACDPKTVYDAFADGGFEALVAKTGKLFEEVPLGQGQVDWDAYLTALRDSGYNGFLTIEREVGADPAADIAMAVGFLQSKIRELGL
ncbi:MAG: sugar phosphate isomerase/epimerase [Lentisphaeria bacterium]|nr:sugar phosphate isomerase/epimerase [Lentisphaeria bacterium]